MGQFRHRRAYHEIRGNPCDCGVDAERHYPDKRLTRSKDKTDRHIPGKITYIGIDGEGQGREDHKYNLLAASSEKGKEWYIEANPGIGRLTTVECLNFILELPTNRNKVFSYSFNYDLTKLLMDLDNQSLFELFRPELRKGFYGPLPIEWCENCKRDKDGLWNCECNESYFLNLQGTKFSVSKNNKRVVIWDLFKFFQAKFVNALQDWKVGTEEIWNRMTLMKDKRSEFDKISKQDIITYCLEETKCMALLARKLIESHESANLKLKTYYGAGSSGAAMLTVMGIKDKLAPTPEAMKEPVASAFFGGRFEPSVIGTIREPLENLDISSAYVYQLAFLPCLQHGSWSHTTKRSDLEGAQAQQGALIRYSLGSEEKSGRFGKSWGPFPFRTEDGTISFPIESGGGWIWRDEFIVGERMFPHVRFEEAWIYSSNCNCKPFGDIPKYYNLRLEIGKEGPGIVIKLGMNSCYGKLAQSIGNALFQSWIWAGMITSGCRAQLLQVLELHKNPANCLMFATDGILTKERGLQLPLPINTNTGKSGKPLGGWERKECPKGVFIARAGVYFPLDPTAEEIKQVRARGVGRGVILNSWKKIIETWEKDGINGIAKVSNVSRFCGAKTSISLGVKAGIYKRAKGKNGKPAYGQWITREIALSFDPMPKRESINDDGVTLKLRKFPKDLMSIPYSRAMIGKSDEAKELKAAMQEMIEQPDADLTDYEEGIIGL